MEASRGIRVGRASFFKTRRFFTAFLSEGGASGQLRFREQGVLGDQPNPAWIGRRGSWCNIGVRVPIDAVQCLAVAVTLGKGGIVKLKTTACVCLQFGNKGAKALDLMAGFNLEADLVVKLFA